MYCYQMQACSWLSSGLEAGTSDDFVQFLDVLGHLVHSAATAWRFPGDAAREPCRSSTLAATIVIIATRGQLGRAKAATAAGSG